MATTTKTKNRITKQAAPVTFYLGGVDKRETRVSRIDAIAERLGCTRSELLQKIADGEFVVIPKQLQQHTA